MLKKKNANLPFKKKKKANVINAYSFINVKSDLKDEIFMVLDRLSVTQRGLWNKCDSNFSVAHIKQVKFAVLDVIIII